ncbi:class I SAM-dependent methyltransferase [Nocardia cyriacigeorgica]|uniref:class I SAM-dependent methyltransferase n=1 Tax=Nocardia cyriacigeorgica TaxID=135487 RepID=UPI0002F1E721|nr:methyltransferase domain-containing protein [Nocardia cyriacigeorgica]AVH21462.1 methyltransferase domain-containing protein [Nocardia cyriacigeorgica]TLF60778.1 methyltransferase domain-containing protein [Nocardia cyriacigeorgica]
MSGLRDRILSTVAGQLGNPHGLLGKVVAPVLNRGNGRAIAAAVDAALEQQPGAPVVADIGFGGGTGLRKLLDRVGAGGVVHGVEISTDMLDRAESGFACDIAAGRLRLTEGSLTALPLDTDSLDAAITCNTIYFVDDRPAACAELARVIRPGGRLVIGIGDPDAMRKMPFTGYGFTLRPVAEVIDTLSAAGCTVEHRRIPNPPIPFHLLIARPAAS